MQMQKDSHALIPLFGEAPPGRRGGAVPEEILRGRRRGGIVGVVGVVGGQVGVQPARGVEPEDGFVAVGAQAGDDALGGVFELAAQGAHDEDGDGGGDGVGDDGGGGFAVGEGRVFGVGELPDGFDEGDVRVFEAGGEVPGAFVVGFRVGFEGGVVGAAEVEDLLEEVRGG